MSAYTSFRPDSEGVIYRTPSGLQGYYARVVRLGGDEMLCSFVGGEGCETADSQPYLTRSFDGGKTWTVQGPVDPDRTEALPPTETGFVSIDGDRLFCLGARFPRDPQNPNAPLVDEGHLGMRQNELALRRSLDGGRTWGCVQVLPKPAPCPLELPTGLTPIGDGRLLLSCSTWREPDGADIYGHRVLVTVTEDDCKTWTMPAEVFGDDSKRVGFWECRVTPFGDALLATCWAHDWAADADIANHFAMSYDHGRTWTPQTASPVMGQTGWPLWVGGNRILFVYNHRRSPVGVRAQLAEVGEGKWETIFDGEVWSPEVRTESAIHGAEYSVPSFQFGAPSAIRLDGNRVMVVYWAVVDGRAGINWSVVELQ